MDAGASPRLAELRKAAVPPWRGGALIGAGEEAWKGREAVEGGAKGEEIGRNGRRWMGGDKGRVEEREQGEGGRP